VRWNGFLDLGEELYLLYEGKFRGGVARGAPEDLGREEEFRREG